MCSVPVAKDPSHRVDPAYKKALVEKPRNGGATLYDLAKDAFARYGSRNCMGSRRLLGWKVPGKVREFSSEVKWHSFAEVGNKSQKFGAAICAMGVKAAPPVTDLNQCTEPCRIAIFENTCAEWMIAAIGAFSQSVTVVTVYATLGMDAVVEAIKDNAIPLLVCNVKDLVRVVSKCSRMSSLHTIVYTMNMVAPSDSKVVPDAPLGVLIVEFDFFCASGNVSAYPPTPPNPDSCAVVTYTSGSTGKPKGVVITHRQVVATCAAAEIAFGIRKGKDVYVAYLPLAHIFEFMAEFTILSQGNVICYADPKSLTKFGAYPIGALEQYAPTLMAAVPKIWDVIYKSILGKIAAASPFSRFFANTAFEWRGFALKHGFDTPLFNNVMFYKLAKVVGGKLR